MLSSNAPTIEVFAGPAVSETVIGQAWGMWMNVSCLPVPEHALQLIQTPSYEQIAVKQC